MDEDQSVEQIDYTTESMAIEDWEKTFSKVLCECEDPTQVISYDEWNSLLDNNAHKGVNVEFRKNWLKTNDYEVNRKNMLDDTLLNKYEKERILKEMLSEL